MLGEGPRKALQHLSFGIFADDVERFHAHLQRCDVARLDPPPGAESNGFWFHDPDGTLVELKVAEKSSPNAKSDAGLGGAPANQRGAPMRGQMMPVPPRRMAHVLLFARDVPRTLAFYTRVMGLRLSDEAGGVVASLHGGHGRDHHMVAFAKSDGPGFHHSPNTAGRPARRAHITNQRTWRCCAPSARRRARSSVRRPGSDGRQRVPPSLADEDCGRLLSWGNHPSLKADAAIRIVRDLVGDPEVAVKIIRPRREP